MENKYPAIDTYRTGQNIKDIMQTCGLSVRDVQDYLELSAPQGIYHWFEGRNMPTLDNLYALSELFNVPVDEMLRGNRKEEFYFKNITADKRVLTYYKKIKKMPFFHSAG
jgi:transcriptional regulator with XRE-family HTH domain